MSDDRDIKMAEIGGDPVAETGSQEQGDIYERHLSSAENEEYGRIKRGLTPRHVQVMAIGGSIGTGLFVGIGGSLSRAGPLSLLLGYLCKSLFSPVLRYAFGLYDKKTLRCSC